MDVPPRNNAKIILWSITALACGVLISGAIITAAEKIALSEGEKSAAEMDSRPESISAAPTSSPDHQTPTFLALLKNRLSDWSSLLGNRAEGALAALDWSGILYPPKATYHLIDEGDLPDVGAFAYVVGDADTGEVIVEKNAEEISPIASVTKLMTALVSLEELDQSGMAKVSGKALGTLGESGALRQGEKLKISDLLYPLLLVSSNDAGEVLAEFKGRDKFLSLMNQKAELIGMGETNYEDPSGLSANNYSTAHDLFTLTHYLFTNHRTVFDITNLDKYSAAGRTWSNANRFSRRDDYLGGKTGYTDKAKRTGVALFKTAFPGYEDRNIAIILLKTDNRTEDINRILAYLKDNVSFSYDKPEKDDGEVTLGFVGDIMMDRGVKTSVYKNFGGDYRDMFENAKFLKQPDIMFANLEGPISDKGTNVGSKFSFRFEPAVAAAVKDSGIDIVSFANNHVGDWSSDAFLDTLGRLGEANILFTGAGETYELAKKPTIIERDGIRVGYLGVSDVGPDWLKAGATTPGILLASDPNLPKIIAEAKANVDVLIVSAHWGDEYKKHTARQESLAKKMIDAGANIVVGHHPHVAQDIAEYKDGLIIYSLGNFIFDQYFSPETMRGAFVEVTIGKDGVVSHEEHVVQLNDMYQPALADAEKEHGDALSFDRGACPSGNSEDDLILFNASVDNSIGSYIPEGLVEIGDHLSTKDGRAICLISEAAHELAELADNARKDGLDIIVTSGFRSRATQEALYNNRSHNDEEEESVAKPGHSEHQLGTTVDLTTSSISEASAAGAFGATAEYKWLSEHAAEYGFVMSYPEGKDTGYIFEPWHWRYLGVAEAKAIKQKGVTIQEFLDDAE